MARLISLRWRTRFGRFVRTRSVTRMSSDLRVTRSTVHGWLSGRHTPRIQFARQIVSLSDGRLELGDVYQHTTILRGQVIHAD